MSLNEQDCLYVPAWWTPHLLAVACYLRALWTYTVIDLLIYLFHHCLLNICYILWSSHKRQTNLVREAQISKTISGLKEEEHVGEVLKREIVPRLGDQERLTGGELL